MSFVYYDFPGFLFKNCKDERMRGFLWVCDELPIVVKLQGEGGDIPHDLDTVVYVVPGNIGHHPVDKHLWQESADASIKEHHSVQRTKLTSPSGQINNLKMQMALEFKSLSWNSRARMNLLVNSKLPPHLCWLLCHDSDWDGVTRLNQS